MKKVILALLISGIAYAAPSPSPSPSPKLARLVNHNYSFNPSSHKIIGNQEYACGWAEDVQATTPPTCLPHPFPNHSPRFGH